MNAIALFSAPSGRRKNPDPCLDFPQKVAIKTKVGFSLEDYSPSQHTPIMETVFRQGGWDATPHTNLARKIALEGLSKGQPANLLWEEQSPMYKRQLVHLESMWNSNLRYSGGVPLTPPVIWGALKQEKFPGENALCEDASLAEKQLDTILQLAKASGREEQGTPESTPKKSPFVLLPTKTSDNPQGGAGEGLEMPPPGIGIGYFAWIKELIPSVENTGPLGRGWGRIAEEKRKSYPHDAGRMDPGCVSIRGFVFATTDGHIVYTSERESEAIGRGLRVLEVARFSTSLIVEDARSFKGFTLVRSAISGVILPSWILFPHGRAWLSDLRSFAPTTEADPLKWILRYGVTRGFKTCTSFIAEPSLGFFPDDGGNPSITAKSFLSAVSVSPYFTLGNEKAPALWKG